MEIKQEDFLNQIELWKSESCKKNKFCDSCVFFEDGTFSDDRLCVIELMKYSYIEMLKKNGAKDIYVCAAHGLFNGPAMQRLNDAPIKEIIVTNSLPTKPNAIDKIKEVDLSVQIAEAMRSISC